jgi:hypothetical protein
MRLAYADPPYPGKAELYADHPDYAGEVDYEALITRLCEYGRSCHHSKHRREVRHQ